MTPKEKAKELLNKFKPYCHFWANDLGRQKDYDIEQFENAKQCALIAVDEIMEFMRMDDEYTETASNANSKWVQYWVDVKREIEKYEM